MVGELADANGMVVGNVAKDFQLRFSNEGIGCVHLHLPAWSTTCVTITVVISYR
jgi:hypothetical protein